MSLISVDGDAETVTLTDAVAAHLDSRPTPAVLTEPLNEIDLTEPVVEPRVGVRSDESIAALIRRAHNDDLTGLSTRASFVRDVERVRFERGLASTSALFLIDLDGFKAVNDTWGHGAGDKVLAEVGRRLRAMFGSTALTSRFGGDEFAVWISDCTKQHAEVVAERLLLSIGAPIEDELILSVGASIGWVTTDDATPIHALLSRADVAMYAIKETGGHGHRVFDRQLASQQVLGRVLQREIRQALTSQQFELAHQPIVTPEGQAIGSEVLARWQHPRRGTLHPGDFLPAVESGGNNGAFDHHILDCALRQLTVQPDLAQLWVNVTGASLNDSLVERLTTLKATGFTPTRLVLEISEHSTADSCEAIAAIRAIASLGFLVAIDDFGSGYSRLEAMTTLPIAYVKIDQQFTANVSECSETRALCTAIVDLIHAIGAEAVAEGIEHADQARVVAEMGCEYLQGYHFGRPTIRQCATGEAHPQV